MVGGVQQRRVRRCLALALRVLAEVVAEQVPVAANQQALLVVVEHLVDPAPATYLCFA